MTAMYPDRREQFFFFPCKELGVEATDSAYIPSHVLRYLMAMSYATDMDQAKRKAYLDFGCGSGFGTEFVGRFFEQSYGVDRTPLCVDYARKIHSRSGSVYLLDRSHLHPDLKFNYITCIEMIEHVPVEEAKKVLKYLASVLTEDGLLFLTTPVATTNDGSNEANPYHVHEYHPGELKMVMQEFFGKVEVKLGPHSGFFVLASEPKR